MRGYSTQLLGCRQHLVSAGAHADVFREVGPVHDPGRVHQKLGGTRDVVLARAGLIVQQVITANHSGIRIRKDGERVSRLAGEIARDLWRVNADGYRENPGCLEIGQTLFDASQLEVTERSPIAAVENQQHRLGRPILKCRQRAR
jgi:hypothetical protein